MFDAKKLLDALGAPAAAPAGPDAAAAPQPAPAKPAAAPALGAGTILSDLIGLANRPSPPAETQPAGSDAAPKPAKPAAPGDLTDLLLGKAQEYLKTPQGNAVVTAAMLGLTKIVVNSETGRKLGASAMNKGTALFNRFVKRPDPGPLLLDAAAAQEPPALAAPAPADSGETALLVMRAMIAAAASDGRIDDTERTRILGALKAVGIDGDGARLIEHELDHPATAADLAAAAKTPEMAVQAYTAARRIITPNTVDERVFLAHLSAALGLAPHIVAHIDADAAGPIER